MTVVKTEPERTIPSAMLRVVGGTEPIARHSLHDDVVTRIRDMIIDGRLESGARINEGPFGASLGISRTPLREALKFLTSEGLVEIVPGRGAIVRKFSAKEVSDTLDMLANLEAMAGRLACGVASDTGIAAVKCLHDRMMTHYAAAERMEYYKLNQDIHSAIVRLANNGALAEAHSTFQSRLKRIRFIGNQEPVKWRGAVGEHKEMIKALVARDGERLANILELHMKRTWERVRDMV